MKSDLKLIEQEITEALSPEERLSVLLEKSIGHYRSYPKQAREWAKQAIKLAKQLDRKLDEGRAHVRLGSAEFQLCEFEAAIISLRTAIGIFDSIEQNSSMKASPLFAIGMTYTMMGRLRESMKLFDEALALSVSQTQRVEILSAMGNTSLLLADFPRALELQYKCLEILDESDDVVRRSFVYCNIANIYLEVGSYHEAEANFERSITLAKEAGDVSGLSTSYYNLASLNQKRSETTKARANAALAQRYAKEAARPDVEAYVLGLLAELEDIREPAKAIDNYERAIDIAKSLDLLALLAPSLCGLGRAKLRAKKYKSAIVTLHEALQLIEDQGQLNVKCECYEALANAHQKVGDLSKALEYFHMYIDINAQVHSQAQQRALVEVRARMEIEKSDRERKRMEQLAMDATARVEALREESEKRSKELTTLALQLVQKNEFLAELKEEIAPLGKATPKTKAIASRIEDHIRSDRDWETFENQFKQVHSEFLQKLSGDHPSLTPTELKIAALIKLNLPSKAIANLFCLSTRTVENHRQNIRKKVKLPADANLVSYFTSL